MSTHVDAGVRIGTVVTETFNDSTAFDHQLLGGSAHLFQGDCLQVLLADENGYDHRLGYGTARLVPDNSIDSIVTDPPYGLSAPPNIAEVLTHWLSDTEYKHSSSGFMNAAWDSFVPGPLVWKECFRVLKPGGHLLAFAGSRTHDLMGMSIRLAGFEIRDNIAWLSAQGFPKSQNVSKAIDGLMMTGKSNSGAIRHANENRPGEGAIGASLPVNGVMADKKAPARVSRDEPATEQGAQWRGFGTALKPAMEPITVARKPLESTVAKNVLAHGTGAINIDGCRVSMSAEDRDTINAKHAGMDEETYQRRPGTALQLSVNPLPLQKAQAHDAGRFPTNLVLTHTEGCELVGFVSDSFARNRTDEWSGFGQKERPGYTSEEVASQAPVYACATGCPVNALDRQSGASTSRKGQKRGSTERSDDASTFGNSGTGFNGQTGPEYSDAGGASRFFPSFFFSKKATKAERPVVTLDDGTVVKHTTVKPMALTQWLVRLVTPPGGVVLDPFAGSGTTLEAASREGVRSIGIELKVPHTFLIASRFTEDEVT